MDPETVSIRTAEPGDLREIVSAYEWLSAPPGSRPPGWNVAAAAASLRRAISSRESVVFVAQKGNSLVGFCTTYLDIESVRFGRRAWVEDLAVHPEFRSRGIGKRLLEAAKDWSRNRGASHLTLESGEARTDAHRFYEREHPSSRSRSFTWRL